MKKLLLLIAAVLLPMMANAQDYFDKGIVYNIVGKNMEVIGLQKGTTNVDIPSSVIAWDVKYPVTSIKAGAFEGWTSIKYLSIPYSIKTIGQNAFRNCGSNITVNIADPESWCKMELGNEHASPLSSAGKMLVFDKETTTINIPSTVTAINAYTFYQCSCLKTLYIPGSVKSISSSAFEDCDYLTTVTLSEGLQTIGGSAFEGCKRLTVLTIPSTVTAVKVNAFKNCQALKEVYCNATSVPTADATAFTGIPSNARLIVPKGTRDKYKAAAGWKTFSTITEVSDADFTENDIFYKLKGDGSVEVIGLASSAKKADIPSSFTKGSKKYSVTSIKEKAFEGRTDITYLSIPYSIKSIGKDAFRNCGPNITVNIVELETWCKMELGNEHASPLSSAGKLLVHDIETTSIDIPKTVTSIAAYTFYQCSCIKKLSIPGTVKSIGSSAFEDCDYLTSVSLSEGLESIGGSAFEGCKRLPSLVIPSTVTTIKVNGFKNCQGLKEVTCKATNVPKADATAFDGIPSGAKLTVPKGTKDKYKAADGWKKFATIEDGSESEVTDFKADGITYHILNDSKVMVMSADKGLKKIELPEVVTNDKATYYVATIGDGAFQNNTAIETVVLPSSITWIGKFAFGACASLKSITIPNSVTEVGEAAFYGCSNLESITIPEKIKTLGDNLFWGCARLTEVTIPEGVTNIGAEAFRECLLLATVKIPSSVTEIGKLAFQKCLKLTDVYCYAESVPKTESDAFDGSPIESATLYVPTKAVDSYKGAKPWSGFKSILAIGSTPGGGETPDPKKADFSVDGIYYKVLTEDYGKLQVVGVDKALTDVEIPELVTYDKATYFVGSVGDGAFQNNSTIETVVLPSSIASIGSSAFGACVSLKSVIIPNSVTEIGDAAFYGCSNLNSINIPNSITKLSDNLFWGCARLTDVTIPHGVTAIGAEAFRECMTLTSVLIPGSVTEIGKDAFQKCFKLTDVYCYAENIPNTDDNAFDGTPIESATLHVPAIAVADYRAAWPWSNFKEVVALDPDGIVGVMQSGDCNCQYYDLTGRKVSRPQKGIYIRNGKKVVVK